MRDLLNRFSAALDAEIAAVEGSGGEQSYELLSGQRDVAGSSGLYIFYLSDALRLPDDASGSLRVDGKTARAMVVSHEGDRVWLLLESTEQLPEYIPVAKLVVNETELLVSLKEKIDDLAKSSDFGLAPKVFGLEQSTVGIQLPPLFDERIDAQTGKALGQCLGSEVTFLWGPPGTGKTFTIAALVASLARLGETVLVTSHTHAAVEQALWALVEPPSAAKGAGYLHDSQFVDDGRILKVGVRQDAKIPRNVCLKELVEDRTNERAENLGLLEAELQKVKSDLARANGQKGPWVNLRDADTRLRLALAALEQTKAAHEQARLLRGEAEARLAVAQDDLENALRSFFIGRGGRVKKTQAEVATNKKELVLAKQSAANRDADVIRHRAVVDGAEAGVVEYERRTAGLPSPEELERIAAEAKSRADELSDQIEALAILLDTTERELVQNAVAIFATLTKLYRDRALINDMKWDTVIIDEASMAMLPLVAYAASRAAKRVVIVGDMYQLPPVVRSDPDEAGGLLSTDIFDFRKVTEAVDSGEHFASLAKLMLQRRMHPDIASVSRALIGGYRDLIDAPMTTARPVPAYTAALGDRSALLNIDISAFNPWSGKLPGTLSRFNFISGHVAVEIASLYAAEIPKPAEIAQRPIGIVTPFAAQRRFLTQLIKTLGLERWVMAGTVHTFQGNECDVVIFDSVLGEPHWTARYTNPAAFTQVRRDLNVAVTRARHQFVFVGDARWLKKHAGLNSGMGRMWNFLNANGKQLDASAVLGDGFRARIAKAPPEIKGWDVSAAGKTVLLTEKDFYPAFLNDLSNAKQRVILYTPFIGKTRWPMVAPHIDDLRERGVEVYLLHKPLSDSEWKKGDPGFGKAVFESLANHGVRLIPISGVHAKTIVIDRSIVYEGSLNWASQVASYEHMWRFDHPDMAKLVEKMLQLEPIVGAFGGKKAERQCPNCHGPLVLVNQSDKKANAFGRADLQPVKFGCLNNANDKKLCPQGYLRRVDGRAPYTLPPQCPLGSVSRLHYTAKGYPWDWRCEHPRCKHPRWTKGDVVT